MKKIIHIITSLKDGGAEASLFRLLKYDTQNTHIVISMMDEGKYAKLLQELGITVHCLKMPRGKITRQGLNNFWNLIKKLKPDLIQTWMYHADLIGAVIAKLQGIPCVWNIRNSDLSPKKTSTSTRIVARVNAVLSYSFPKKVISCAQQSVDVHKKIGYKKNNFFIIPNGYHFENFFASYEKVNLIKNNLNLPSHVPILGMVARFDPQKDHYNLLQALHYLRRQPKDFRCLLIGFQMDATNRKLAQWIVNADLQNKVILLGQRSDIPIIMNSLDIHVLSSCGEAFPNVIAEAMGCGTPCITTNVGDAALIVGDTGWVVPSSNSQALADAILAAIQEKEQNPIAWQARKRAAKQRIMDNFSIERMVATYNQVWQEIKK